MDFVERNKQSGLAHRVFVQQMKASQIKNTQANRLDLQHIEGNWEIQASSSTSEKKKSNRPDQGLC